MSEEMPEVKPGETIVDAVERVIVAVRNLAEAEEVYTRILGRMPSWRHRDPGGGTAHVVFRLDNMSLELVEPVNGGPWGKVTSRYLDGRGEGVMTLVLRTPDAEKAARALTAIGLAAVALPQGEARDGSRVRSWRNVLMPTSLTRGVSLLLTDETSRRENLPPAELREGVAAADAISALDHIVIMTADAEAMKVLLGDKLGIRLALDQSKPEWGVRQLFFRLGGVTIEVVEPLDKAKAPADDHYWGLAWKAGNVATMRERLLRDGVEVSDVRRGRKKGTEVATLRPPTMGIPTLLVGPVPAAD